jgi:hypothetical protein
MESKPSVYIPEDAKLNITDKPMPPPTTLYERTRQTIEREVVKDIVKGKYGSENENTTTGL